uniref:Uncharacterized protein n=1 Tax=Arundo donax TaxID=35708 RepID=A0A0A9DUC1_ARUDO
MEIKFSIHSVGIIHCTHREDAQNMPTPFTIGPF